MTIRRRRSLSGEERRLWAEVLRSVSPLAGRTLPEIPAETAAPPATPARPGARPPATSGPVKAVPPPLIGLERRVARALSRGALRPDATLDLHGLTQAEAHLRLLGFLRHAQGSGFGLVSVITGRGRPEAGGGHGLGERGVLRRVVPHWLGLPELRGIVAGFDEAGPRQGGVGALYVRLRRIRPRR